MACCLFEMIETSLLDQMARYSYLDYDQLDEPKRIEIRDKIASEIQNKPAVDILYQGINFDKLNLCKIAIRRLKREGQATISSEDPNITVPNCISVALYYPRYGDNVAICTFLIDEAQSLIKEPVPLTIWLKIMNSHRNDMMDYAWSKWQSHLLQGPNFTASIVQCLETCFRYKASLTCTVFDKLVELFSRGGIDCQHYVISLRLEDVVHAPTKICEFVHTALLQEYKSIGLRTYILSLEKLIQGCDVTMSVENCILHCEMILRWMRNEGLTIDLDAISTEISQRNPEAATFIELIKR